MHYLKSNFFIHICLMGIKILFVHLLLFNKPSFTGAIFDIIFIFFLFSIYELLLRGNNTYLYFLSNIFLSIALFSIVIYNEYYGTILTYKDLFHMNQLPEVKDSVINLIQPVHFLLFFDLFIISFILFKKRRHNYHVIPKKLILAGTMIILVIFLLLGNGEDVDQIINETYLAKKIGLFRYEIHIVKAEDNNHVGSEHYSFSHKLHKLKGMEKKQDNRKYFGLDKNKHVIAIQLEAVQAFPLFLTINDKEITPNLNRLARKGIYFPNTFQQIGKGNTSDAEFIFNTSIYPSNKKATAEEYGNRDIPSFPKLLAEKGYRTVTFHTNNIDFWNRDELYEALGFHEAFDKSYFGTEDTISYGASDEVLYEKSFQKLVEMDKKGEKFFAHLITLSSHHPYKIPKEKQVLQLPEEYNDSNVADYLQAVAYADHSLGKFIEKLKRDQLFHKSVIVVYGDHFGLDLKTEKDRKLMKKLLGREYHDQLDKFNIPFLIHSPSLDEPFVETNVGGQVDMLPTVANILGIDLTHFIYFGRDLLNTETNLIGNRFYLPTGTFIKNELFFIPGESFSDGKAYSIETKEEIEDFTQHAQSFDEILELLELSDQYLNSLPKRDGNHLAK